jgi:hypothetical protein
VYGAHVGWLASNGVDAIDSFALGAGLFVVVDWELKLCVDGA